MTLSFALPGPILNANPALVGAGLGAGLGAISGLAGERAKHRPGERRYIRSALLGGGIGAGIGAAAGAAMNAAGFPTSSLPPASSPPEPTITPEQWLQKLRNRDPSVMPRETASSPSPVETYGRTPEQMEYMRRVEQENQDRVNSRQVTASLKDAIMVPWASEYMKRAFSINPTLAGAGIGAAGGLLRERMKSNPDERNYGRGALVGGAIGGAAGFGLGKLRGAVPGMFGTEHGIEDEISSLTPEEQEKVRNEMGFGSGMLSGLGSVGAGMLGAGVGSTLGGMSGNPAMAGIGGLVGGIGGGYLGGRFVGKGLAHRTVGQLSA